MGCLVIGLYVLGFLFFFLTGIATWSEGDYAVSIILYLLSFVFVFLMIRKAEYKKIAMESVRKDNKEDNTFILNIKTSCNTVEVSDDELQEMERKRNLKIEVVITQPGIKYNDIKFINYNGEELDLMYREEISLCSDILYQLFNSYLALKECKDIYEIEKQFNNYSIDYKRFLKVRDRKDFVKIYREAKHQYRQILDTSFPMALTKAVNNPELFNIDFDKLCVEAIKNYREYWINVLHSYKRKSAFENRKTYLFNTINTIMTYNCLSNNQEAQDLLKDFHSEVCKEEYK